MYKYREEWLQAAVEELRVYFELRGEIIPENVVCACGWPGIGNITKTIGSCWDLECSDRKYYEIFISPLLSEVDTSTGVLATLIHELCHSVVGIDQKHNKNFKAIAKKMGLVGKMTATYVHEDFIHELVTMSQKLGEYPHKAIHPKTKESKERKKYTHKVSCPDCQYTVKIATKFIERGIPSCPCCGIKMEIYDD